MMYDDRPMPTKKEIKVGVFLSRDPTTVRLVPSDPTSTYDLSFHISLSIFAQN